MWYLPLFIFHVVSVWAAFSSLNMNVDSEEHLSWDFSVLLVLDDWSFLDSLLRGFSTVKDY